MQEYSSTFFQFIFNKRTFLSLISRKEVFTFVRYSNTFLKHQFMRRKTSHASSFSRFPNLLSIVLLTAALLTCSSALVGQGWEKHYGTTGDDLGHAVIQTKDLGFLAVGFSNRLVSDKNFDVYVVKTDVDGTELWSRFFNDGLTDLGYGVIQTPDNGFLLVGDTRLTEQSNSNVLLIKLDAFGNKIWSKQFGGSNDDSGFRIIPTVRSGGYLIVGSTSSFGAGSSDVLLIKLDANGNEVWTEVHGTAGKDAGRAVIEVSDGYLVTGHAFNAANNSSDLYLLKADFAGKKVWDKFFGTSQIDEGHSLVQMNDGNFAIAGFTGAVSDVYLVKVNPSGGLIWQKNFGNSMGDAGFDMVKASNGDLVISGITEINPTNTDAYLLRVDAAGNKIWSTNIGRGSHVDWGQGLAATHDGGFVVVGYNSQFGTLINDLTLIKTGGQGTVFTNRVKGKVFIDNNDCIYSAGEEGLTNWIIRATSSTKTYFGSTDASGNYDIELDKGSYSVSLLPRNAYWNACIAAYNVNFNNEYDTLIRHFPVIKAVQCPLLEIDVSAPVVQACSKVNYVVSYCNTGVTRAGTPSVHIILDKKLTLTGASIPWGSRKDSLYIFSIPALEPQQCGQFTFTATADCLGPAGQTYSVQARILPDTICLPASAQWDRSSIAVNGYCDKDSVRFRIQNRGIGDMQQPLNFIVIEDHIMLRAPTQFQLRSGQEQAVNLRASGSTYRLISDQSPNHPGRSLPTVAVEGCTTGSAISTGFVTAFQENENEPFISIDAQEERTTTDYILLRGYPKGHFRDGKFLIPANTDLEYQIYFRNNSPDTIRRLVIIDTLPASLNLATITAGASTHPYSYEVYGTGVLKIAFNNVQLLPDGSTNSSGFVKFKVSQKPDNPPGTEIPNSAAIFFESKAPVKTANLLHIVGKGKGLIDFIQIITDVREPEVTGVELNVWPNPFDAAVEFEAKSSFFNRLELILYDLQGSMVRREVGSGNALRMYRNALPAGIYAYQFKGDGKLLGTGKLIVR